MFIHVIATGSCKHRVGICRDDGLSDFNALRSRRRDHDVTLIAFDLIEAAGDRVPGNGAASGLRQVAV